MLVFSERPKFLFSFSPRKLSNSVYNELKKFSIKTNQTTKKLAIQWSIQKGNFSGRTALQFAKNYLLNKL